MSKTKNFRPRPNFVWSILSVAGVLFLLGLFGLITIHSSSFMESLKEEFEMIVEINPKASEKQIEKLSADLASESGVLKGSVRFTSKEEGLKLLSEDLGDELLKMEMPNPLPDIVTFRLDGETFDLARLEAIREKYQQGRPEVLSIYYQEGLIEGVVTNLDRISYVFLGAGFLLSVLALMLIYNAIRLSIYANRFLIRNMELVGASWGFIRRPFLQKSVQHGLISAVIAIASLLVVYGLASERLPELTQYLNRENILYLILMLVVAGMMINLASTWIVVTRFLSMRSHDLHL